MRSRNAPELVISGLAAVLLVGAVVGLTRSKPDSGREVAGPSAVQIVDFAFGPKELAVPLGGTITWTNADGATHTVTGRENEILKSPDLKTDDTYAVTFEGAGTFEYICKFHPNMQGTITVEG